MNSYRFITSTIFLLTSSAAFAAGGGILARPLTGGIVFPSLNDSTTGNPAGLVQERATAFQVDYSPPIQSGYETHYFGANVATGHKGWGLGGGVTGAKTTEKTSVRTADVGAAAGIGIVSLGADARFPISNSGDSSKPYIGAGLMIGGGHGFQLGANWDYVESGVSSSILTVGAGWGLARKFYLECDFTPPLFAYKSAEIDYSAYALTATATGYMGIFGIQGIVGYAASTMAGLSSSRTPYGGGLSIGVSRNVGLSAQYMATSSSSKSLNAALTVAF